MVSCTDLHQLRTGCSYSIAIKYFFNRNCHISTRSERQPAEWRPFCQFCTKLVAVAKSLVESEKRGLDWSSTVKYLPFSKQEAFEKCWAHSPLGAAARAMHQVSLQPPAHRCPRQWRRQQQQQRQRVTEGTAMAPWNGPKNVKIGLVDPEIIGLWAIFKNTEIMEGNIFSPVGKFAERAKNSSKTHSLRNRQAWRAGRLIQPSCLVLE